MRLELNDLPFDRGGALLVKRAVRNARRVTVSATYPDTFVHLRAWCRVHGHDFEIDRENNSAVVTRGDAETQRWSGFERAGAPEAMVELPPQRWGLAARGALVEAGSPEFHFALSEKLEVWSEDAPRIYAQAAASQWDPATAIPWDTPFELPGDVEDAVVQLTTYLVENETAALIVPSRFVAQIHPHLREVMQVLAIQAADEARHIEVFTRRALQTLVEEPDFAIASFLLSVLGEGTFLSLLWFIQRFAPDPVTAAVCRLAAQDEARHVAFGMSHLRRHIRAEPAFRETLASAVHRRHDALRHTAGLNTEVFEALIILAAGSWEPADLIRGSDAVDALVQEMNRDRVKRLEWIGFPSTEAEELSTLHTRNFM